jgi:hypothetical protein
MFLDNWVEWLGRLLKSGFSFLEISREAVVVEKRAREV